jgi:hypothetical protein
MVATRRIGSFTGEWFCIFEVQLSVLEPLKEAFNIGAAVFPMVWNATGQLSHPHSRAFLVSGFRFPVPSQYALMGCLVEALLSSYQLLSEYWQAKSSFTLLCNPTPPEENTWREVVYRKGVHTANSRESAFILWCGSFSFSFTHLFAPRGPEPKTPGLHIRGARA